MSVATEISRIQTDRNTSRVNKFRRLSYENQLEGTN